MVSYMFDLKDITVTFLYPVFKKFQKNGAYKFNCKSIAIFGNFLIIMLGHIMYLLNKTYVPMSYKIVYSPSACFLLSFRGGGRGWKGM